MSKDESAEKAEEQPAPAQNIRAIVAGHGDFPDGIVSAVQQICGRGRSILALSNRGLSGEDIETRLRDYIDKYGVRVFFTDLPGGSATFAVRRLMRSNPEIVLVTGANLATLLDFVFESDSSPQEAAQRAADKGKAALTICGGGK
jgi:PTS system N-acetylgalactosamine-specific IIA component